MIKENYQLNHRYMKTREELIKSPGYWLEEVQGEVFRLLKEYMDENKLSQKDIAAQFGFSPSYISQILNGNFNFTVSKLIELSLAVGKVPEIHFVKFNDYLVHENTPGLQFRYTFGGNTDGGMVVPISSELHYDPVDTWGKVSFNQ